MPRRARPRRRRDSVSAESQRRGRGAAATRAFSRGENRYYAYKHTVYDGDGWRAGLERYAGEAVDMNRRYYTVWVPANLLVFTVVPVPLRIGFIATTSLGWLTASSFFTHQH